MMTDDKTNRGEPDRRPGSGEEDYELRHFTEKHGISVETARQLIDTHGHDRAALDAAAARMRSS